MTLKEDQNGVIRDERGRWPAGQSGNPAGRRPRRQDEQARDDVAPYLGTALEQLGEAVKKGQSWAIVEVLNRTYGKPTDKIDLGYASDALPDMTDEQISSVLAEYEPPALPDGTAPVEFAE